MKCKYCGNENDIGSTFCSSCGKNIKEVEVNNDKIKTEGVKKNKIIFLSSISTIFLACIMLITMLLVNKNNPKSVFTNFTNKMYKEYNTQVSKKYDTASETLEIIPKIESTDLGEISTLLNNLKIIINASVDKKSNKMGYNIKTLYKNEDLLNISSIIDKDLYIKFNNLYDKYLKLEETNNIEIDLSNSDDLNVVLKKSIDAFNNSLKNSYFKTSTEKVKTNGKEIKSKVYILNINNKNIKDIEKSISKSLINDKEFLNSYSKISGESIKNIKKSLKEEFTSSKIDSMNIKLYTKSVSNEVYKIGFASDEIELSVEFVDDNQFILMIKSNNQVLSFNINNSIKYNDKVKFDSIDNYVTEKEFATSFDKVISNFMNQKGYKLLNEDVKSLFGYDLNSIMQSLISEQ